MRSLAWATVAAFLFLSMPVGAAPGHGLVASDETMYIHFLSDRLALQPTVPTTQQLRDPSNALPACGTSLRWQAGFTQGVPDATGAAPNIPGLARNATFDAATNPSITWYVESLMPVTGEPLPLPITGANATITLRTGDDLTAWGDGQTLAEFAQPVTLTAVAAGGRQVYVLSASSGGSPRPAWLVNTLQPGDALQLEVEVRFGNSGCETTWPTLRAYSADGLRPRVVWRLFDPIRIESITADPRGDGAAIKVVAASPWGPSRIAPIEAPKIAGSGGPATGVALQDYTENGIIEATWDWTKGTAPNGTYRADITVNTPQGDYSVSDFVLFQIGGQRNVTTTPTPTPSKDTPVPVAAVLVALMAAVAVRRR